MLTHISMASFLGGIDKDTQDKNYLIENWILNKILLMILSIKLTHLNDKDVQVSS